VNTPDFDAMLAETLTDGRLSRGERHALSAWIRDSEIDERPLAALRHRAFEIARRHAAGTHGSAVMDWLEDVVKALCAPAPARAGSARACFSPGEDCYRTIIGHFASARTKADVCVFTITDDRITRAMLDAHRRGVGIRVITDNDKSADLGSDIEELRRTGIAVCEDQSPFHMHHKFSLFDGRTVLTGSYNWTRGAADSNEENLVVVEDARLFQQFQSEFNALWRKLAPGR